MAQVKHSSELQSLRGIAALCVLVHHSFRTLEMTSATTFISETLLNAHAAVVIFFVLSGYVLANSLIHRGINAANLRDFYVRRLFRVYPAMWVGLAAGVAYMLILQPLTATHLSAWMQGHYQPSAATPSLLAQSALGLHTYLLPPLWTITVELAASAILPSLVLAMRGKLSVALGITVALALVSLISGVAARQVPLYLVHFSLGALLATQPKVAMLAPGKLGLLIATVVLLAFRTIYPWDYHAALPGLVEGLAATAIVAGLVRTRVPLLQARPLVLLGDWSFSLYLLHVPIAFAVTRLLVHFGLIQGSGVGSSAVVVVTTLALTVPIAASVYRFVEIPGIEAGKLLIKRIQRKGTQPPSHLGEKGVEAG